MAASRGRSTRQGGYVIGRTVQEEARPSAEPKPNPNPEPHLVATPVFQLDTVPSRFSSLPRHAARWRPRAQTSEPVMTFHIQTVEEFSQRQGHVDGSIKDLGVYLKSQGKRAGEMV